MIAQSETEINTERQTDGIRSGRARGVSLDSIDDRGRFMCWSTWEIIKFLDLTLAIFGGFVVAFYLMFWLLDRGLFPTTGSGKITKKFLCQRHYRNPIMVGFAAVPYGPVQTSTTYRLRVLIAGGDSNISVSQRFYDCVSVGGLVHARYSVGRFSQRIYLRKVWN